ncbi:hypothetical protein GGS21DRAFT_429275 [Xylaria nigripes]|nr:hypothetical protein GGS21DRAFT_429275 [Xylaria nigripes]
MELTPMKVRGKRRAQGEQILVKLEPKRRNKGLSRNQQSRPRRPKASNIEKSLPLEVLEHILWLSENVNFPRASPRLGRLLSAPSTLRETFLAAFGPTWDVWFGCVNGRDTEFPVVHSYAEWGDDTIRFGGNPAFQTDILACSWATIDLMLDCRDIWIRRHAQNRPFEHVHLWGIPITPCLYTGTGVAVGVSGIKEARYYFYHDYEAFRNIEQMNSYTAADSYLSERCTTWIEVHRSTQIPDELLTGPWDEKDLQKLFWLIQAGARLSPDQTWELTCEGYREATLDPCSPNVTVIRILRSLDAFRKWPHHIRVEELFKISNLNPDNRDDPSIGTVGNNLNVKYYYIEKLLEDPDYYASIRAI